MGLKICLSNKFLNVVVAGLGFTLKTSLLEPRSKVPSCVILEALAEADPGAVPVIKPTSGGLVILYLEALLPTNL